MPLAEFNLLCVHKKLCSKRLAPVLIKEVTRRINITGLFQAVYTAGVRLPTPFSSARYQHRNLNPRKLIDVGFSHLPQDKGISDVVREFSLPSVFFLSSHFEILA